MRWVRLFHEHSGNSLGETKNQMTSISLLVLLSAYEVIESAKNK
jgi:hypothetical protein